ncbi:hypothetical protein SAMN05421827_12516 [Pedobacter terrae]|uniref:Uncharacterized protein n=1 Tax=Pedobacter terrae TaxID=405671 RepID=A0A1G8CJ33_9SPHI|nr:hypothetical protein [Pedobacter terrae]SDH45456.1 hypothetical protein SAMN05421827_12516 [Pedobacter terrae]
MQKTILISDNNNNLLFEYLLNQSEETQQIINVEIGSPDEELFYDINQNNNINHLKIPFPHSVSDDSILSNSGKNEFAMRIIDVLKLDSVISKDDSLTFIFHNFNFFYLANNLKYNLECKLVVYVDTLHWESSNSNERYMKFKEIIDSKQFDKFDLLRDVEEESMLKSFDTIVCYDKEYAETLEMLYDIPNAKCLPNLLLSNSKISSFYEQKGDLINKMGFGNEKIILIRSDDTPISEITNFLRCMVNLRKMSMNLKVIFIGEFDLNILNDDFFLLTNSIIFTGKISAEYFYKLLTITDIFISLKEKVSKDNVLENVVKFNLSVIGTQTSIPISISKNDNRVSLVPMISKVETSAIDSRLLTQSILNSFDSVKDFSNQDTFSSKSERVFNLSELIQIQ